MAALDDAEETLRSTRTKANFQRLTRLLMSGGAVLLREIFDSYHSPASLPTILSKPSVEGSSKQQGLPVPTGNVCTLPQGYTESRVILTLV